MTRPHEIERHDLSGIGVSLVILAATMVVTFAVYFVLMDLA